MKHQMNILFLIITIIKLAQTKLCNKDLSVTLTNRTYRGVIYNESEIFIEEDGVVRGCVCEKMLCARKCCPFGQAYNKKCVNTSIPFNPPVKKDNHILKEFNALKSFHFVVGMMNCTPDFRMRAYKSAKVYYLTTNGSLYMQLQGMPPMLLQPSKYCIENMEVMVDGKSQTVLETIFCYTQKPSATQHVLNSICMLVSCFFILLTVGAYALLPSQLRKVHVRVLIAYLLSFFVAFLCLAIITLMKSPKLGFCIIFTFIIYFSLLSAFSWMNVMCYDIWCTFRGDGMSQITIMSSQKLFYKYCAYAFGIPTALTALLALFEYVKMPFYVPVLPKLTIQKCFFDGEVKLFYLYMPILILCIANIIFFVVTAIKITQLQREIGRHMSEENNTTHNKRKQRYSMYIHLFVLMGVNWILEIVSYLYPDAYIVWNITDAYNALIGFFIFFIVICKKNVYEEFKNRFTSVRSLPSCSKAQKTSTNTLSTQASSGKHDIQLNSVKKTQEAEI